MLAFKMLDPRMTNAHLGFIPSFLSADDPRPAREQLDTNYAHGGGWCPVEGFKMNPVTHAIRYPGGPPHKALAVAKLRDELIVFYTGAWLAIVHPDNSYEIARVD